MKLKSSVDKIAKHVAEINNLMAELAKQGVEVRISYHDKTTNPNLDYPKIELWRATQHVDLLKTTVSDE